MLKQKLKLKLKLICDCDYRVSEHAWIRIKTRVRVSPGGNT